jgi:hypothetical protein
MNGGGACKLCGRGGCSDFIEFQAGDVKITCFICDRCKSKGWEDRVKSRLVAEMYQRMSEGKAPGGVK